MPNRILIKLLQPPLKQYQKYQAKSAISRLTTHESAHLQAIGEALAETLSHSLSPEEKATIDLIEQRRTSLLNSDEVITVIDYGAGSRGAKRTKEEMAKGVQSAARVADVCKASKPAFWATFLFKLIRKLQPLSCVELGACVGISAAYQASALKINGKGRLFTIEGSPEVANIARETLAGLGLENATVVVGPFQETLSGVLESASPIDYFFNDGHHDHDAVLHYFAEALPHLSDGAVIVFDDISWSEGMRRAWSEIENDERIIATVDLQTMGIAVMGSEPSAKEKIKIQSVEHIGWG